MAGSSGSAGGMYSLKWAHHQNYLTSGLAQLLEDTDDPLTDVTLACQGQFIQAHKVVLSVSSTFFKQMFRVNRSDKVGNTIVIVPHVTFKELQNLVRFIYYGQVNIPHEDLNRFLEAANVLQIEGLAADLEKNEGSAVINDTMLDAAVTSKRGSSSSSHSVIGIASQPNSNSSGPPVKRSRLSVSSGVASLSTTPPQAQSTSASAASRSVCPPQPTSASRFSSNSPCNNSSSPLVITGTTSVTLPIIPESERDYDPLEDAGDGDSLADSGEEMISLDAMKSEPIAVYSMNDENEGDLDSHDQSNINPRGNDSSEMMYSYESALNQSLDAGRPGPSSGLAHPHAVIPSRSSKPSSVFESEGIFHPEVLTQTQANNFVERAGIKMRCKKCGGEFISEIFRTHPCLTFGDSTMHITEAKNLGDVQPVQCIICLRVFKNKNSLKVHKSTKHRNHLKEPSSSGVRLGNFADVIVPATAGESIIEFSQQTHHNQYPGTMSSPTQHSRTTSSRLDIKPEPTFQQMQMSAAARLQDIANQSRESSQDFFNELGIERGPPKSEHQTNEVPH